MPAKFRRLKAVGERVPGWGAVPVRGFAAYAYVVALIKREGPMDHRQVAEHTGRGDFCRWTLSMLHDIGALRIKRWVPTGRRWIPKMAFGPGRDAAYPVEGEVWQKPLGGKHGQHFQIFAAIWSALDHGSTAEQITEASGVNRVGVLLLLRDLRRYGLVRVTDWIRRSGMGGEPSPIYGLGHDEDALRPIPLTREEHDQRAVERRAQKRQRKQEEAAEIERRRLVTLETHDTLPEFVHVTVPAGSAPLPKTAGAPSVFHLARQVEMA